MAVWPLPLSYIAQKEVAASFYGAGCTPLQSLVVFVLELSLEYFCSNRRTLSFCIAIIELLFVDPLLFVLRFAAM